MKNSKLLTAATILLTMSACGGGGSPTTTGPPVVVSEPAAEILFPPAQCHTDGYAVFLRGTVRDLTDLEGVLVNGDDAGLPDPETGVWTYDLSLDLGMNSASVDIVRSTGMVEEDVAQCTVVRKEVILESCQDLVWGLEPDSPIIWLDGERSIDRKLVAIPADGGALVRIPTDAEHLEGDDPHITRDPANGLVYLATSNPGRIVEINPANGDVQEYSGPDTGLGIALDEIRDIAFSGTGLLWVLEDGGRLSSVDKFGDRVDLEIAGLPHYLHLSLDDLRNRAYLGTEDEIHEVDLVTGLVHLVSGGDLGVGPDFEEIKDLHYDSLADAILVADNHLTIVKVDPISGNRETPSLPEALELGRPVYSPNRIAGNSLRQEVVVSCQVTGGLTKIGVHNGLRTQMAETQIGQGFNLDLLVLEDRVLRLLYGYTSELDPEQLISSIISTPRMGGESSVIWSLPEAIGVIAEGRTPGEVMTLVDHNLVAIDMATGLHEVLPEAAGLAEFTLITEMIREDDGMYRVLGATPMHDHMRSVLLDPDTGQSCCVLESTFEGEVIDFTNQGHYDPTVGLLLFNGRTPDIGWALFLHDPELPEAEIFTSELTHIGPEFGRPSALFRNGDATVCFVGQKDAVLIEASALTGERSTLSEPHEGYGPMPETNLYDFSLVAKWDDPTSAMFCLGGMSDRVFVIDSVNFGDRVILGLGD